MASRCSPGRERDADAAERWFKRSIDLFREMDTPFALARAQLQYAEWLSSASAGGGAVDQLADEAAMRFEALGARPWLARVRALRSPVAA